MKNTAINEADRLYIIAFGDSRKYLLPAKENEDAVTNLERELNEYLSSRFPGENFAYFTTPEITEVDKADAPDYPLLDDKAKDEIKRILLREIQVMHENKELNSNDPWGA